MRYVYTPPNKRQQIMVGGRVVTLGQEFDASEAFAASQPAGWCTPAAEYHATQAALVEAEAARTEQHTVRLLPGKRRPLVGSISVEDTHVAPAAEDDPELVELNAAAIAEGGLDDGAAEGAQGDGAPVPPAAKRGPGRPPGTGKPKASP